MLEFLANVDPMSLPLWAVLVFAAGMYPVGLMLGAPCSPCCGCELCPDDTKLPDTLTVTFDGLPEQVPGPDLCTLTFSSCYGSGAAGKVTSPGGDPVADKGPIMAVALTNGGSGYAKLGRVEPSVTASGGSGTGATLAVTLAEDADGCGIPFWKVDSVSVADGTGYADGDPVTFTIAEGDTEASAASATIHTTRNEPTLSASAPLGSGAAFTLSYTKNAGTPETWTISSVSVTSGGTGYHGGDSLTISLDTDDVEQAAAYAQIVTSRSEPTLSAGVSSETGSGATLSVSLSATYDPGGDAWAVSSLGIEDGGSGYAVDDAISISVDDGEQAPYEAAYAYVSSVDENGAITGIEIGYGGVYYKDEGIITSVALYYGGAYYKDDGVPVSVSVDGGGVYYREDSTEPPYVAEVTVSIAQTLPSDGAGATITATVGDDPGVPATFGTITGLTIEGGGGDGYLAWQWLNTKCCASHYEGKTFVLKRGKRSETSYISGDRTAYTASNCEFEHRFCGVGNLDGRFGVVRVRYRGPSQYPLVELKSELLGDSSDDFPSALCNTVFTSSTLIDDCAELSFTATSSGGATAAVSVGGDYDNDYLTGNCFICCKGEDELPEEINASFAGADAFYSQYDGDYVLRLDDVANGTRASATWWCGVPDVPPLGENAAGKLWRIQANLLSCSVQSRSGFGSIAEQVTGDPLPIVCDDCHTKCLTEVAIGILTPVGVLDAVSQHFASHRFGELLNPDNPWDFSVQYTHCDELCEATPQCRPASGEYSVRQYSCYGGGIGCLNFPIGTVTIT